MEYMHRGSVPPAPYMPMPRYLLGLPISSTAKILYTVLLSRALLSAQNDGWTDAQGRVYQYYTIEDLGKTLCRSRRAIQNALDDLEKNDLIHREHQSPGRANQIYVMVAQPAAEENCTPQRQKTTTDGGKKLRTNNQNVCRKRSNDTDQTGGYETL